jgi:hypothetical protein
MPIRESGKPTAVVSPTAGGVTTFFITPSGSLTSAGAYGPTTVNTVPAGATTPTGAHTLVAGISVVGAISAAAGAYGPTTVKMVPSGAVAPTGAYGPTSILKAISATLTTAGAPNPIEQVRVTLPASDVVLGPWISTGASGWAEIDEPTGAPDIADYVEAAVPGEAQFGLQPLINPAGSTRHRVFYSVEVPAGTHNLTFRIREGPSGVERASWAESSVAGPIVMGMYELSGAEADSIFDYNALRITVEKT